MKIRHCFFTLLLFLKQTHETGLDKVPLEKPETNLAIGTL